MDRAYETYCKNGCDPCERLYVIRKPQSGPILGALWLLYYEKMRHNSDLIVIYDEEDTVSSFANCSVISSTFSKPNENPFHSSGENAS